VTRSSFAHPSAFGFGRGFLEVRRCCGSQSRAPRKDLVFRKNLIDLLQGNPMTVTQIARQFGQTPGDVADDLEHLLLSLKHSEYSATVLPASCRKCGFQFAADKLRKPSKCPSCHSTWLLEPRVSIERRS
jgi:predicted Zn-ribbon and HTH transcriptional regulator